jgi:hypothetical protein
VRNNLIERFLLPRHDFVFWLDADLTVVPSDIIQRLYRANPTGISAPLVLLDSGAKFSRLSDASSSPGEEWLGRIESPMPPSSSIRFYDTAAFVQEGQLVQRTSEPGKALCGHRNYGSVTALPPYFNYSSAAAGGGVDGARTRVRTFLLDERVNVAAGPGGVVRRQRGAHGLLSEPDFGAMNERRALRGQPLKPRVVPCDSVGTTYLIPASVYRWRAGGAGATSPPPRAVSEVPAPAASAPAASAPVSIRHYAHVLTEHFPVVHAAKYLLGVEVVAVPSVRVMHADLPMFGEGFHGNAFDRCRSTSLSRDLFLKIQILLCLQLFSGHAGPTSRDREGTLDLHSAPPSLC